MKDIKQPPRRAAAALLRLWRELYARAPRRERTNVSALLFLAAVTEGLAIALLVPLLRAIGQSPGERASAAWGDVLASWNPAFLSLTSLLGAFLAVAFFRALIAWRADISSTKLRLDLVRNLRVALYGAIANANWTFLRSRKGGDIQASLTSEVDRIASAVYFALQAPSRALMIAAHVAVAAMIAPLVTIAALAAGTIIAYFARGYLGESLRLGERLSESYASLHHQILEFIGGLKVTKSLGAEAAHQRAFAKTVAGVDDNVLAYTRSAATARMMQDLAGAFAVTGFIWASVTLAGLGAAEVLVLALILYRLLPLVQGLQQSTQELLHMAPAARGVFDLLDACEQERERAAHLAGATRLAANLQVQSLSFRHEGEARPILDNVSFSLKAGTLTVLSGASGAGKSTLLDLLAGLLRPSAGAILVNGEALSPEAAMTWRTQVGYLGQDSFLFHDTMRANLLVARPDANDQDLQCALEHAGAAQMIAHLPDGLDTIAGDRGARLSGGERQRIALARALLRQPSLLILDEPTSALDEQTERRVLQSVAALKGTTTILIVTHRPDNVPGADLLLRIEDGRILETRPVRDDARDALNAKAPE